MSTEGGKGNVPGSGSSKRRERGDRTGVEDGLYAVMRRPYWGFPAYLTLKWLTIQAGQKRHGRHTDQTRAQGAEPVHRPVGSSRLAQGMLRASQHAPGSQPCLVYQTAPSGETGLMTQIGAWWTHHCRTPRSEVCATRLPPQREVAPVLPPLVNEPQCHGPVKMSLANSRPVYAY